MTPEEGNPDEKGEEPNSQQSPEERSAEAQPSVSDTPSGAGPPDDAARPDVSATQETFAAQPPAMQQPPFRHEASSDADIPMPHATRSSDRRRARDARANLDLDLSRIKRRKRYGALLAILNLLFLVFVLAPVAWVALYLFVDPPGTVLMVQRAAAGEAIRYRPIAIDEMSPHIAYSVIAAEDANFCSHDGFDFDAIRRAAEANASGGRLRGASTISQQAARNLFLWMEPPSLRGGPLSWVRKGLETYFTALIEFMWPKRRIMEAYLNVAEWGDGNFGIEAAARARFGVSADRLTPLQAARLAAVLPSPNRWRADRPGPYVLRRSGRIVGLARDVRNSGAAACVLASPR